MRLLREDVIHYHVREALVLDGWRLIAGQYPNGSDDDLPILNIVDPLLARDQSPDHRRHSLNKLVPDLVAIKGRQLLIAEMKPLYDAPDEAKLVHMITERRLDLNRSVDDLNARCQLGIDQAANLVPLPVLGFSDGVPYPARADFGYVLISSPTTWRFAGLLGQK